jgi:HK97 family phage prohead protease
MKVEIRSDSEVVISGYVNVTERDSKVLPKSMSPRARTKFVERVRSGAFSKAITAANNVGLKFNHQKQLGSSATGELELREDAVGLFAVAKVNDAEVVKAARANELRGWSFGFRAGDNGDKWETVSDELERRTLDVFNLTEVSILTKNPAYTGTSIEVRAVSDEESEVYAESRAYDDTAEVTDNGNHEPNPAVDYTLEKAKIELLKLKGAIL